MTGVDARQLLAAQITTLDLSLSRTGVTIASPGGSVVCDSIRGKGDGHSRMMAILDQVDMAIDGSDLVVVEGPSYGSTPGQRGHHERAGLWWLVTHQLLWRNLTPYAVVPPGVLKKYATGNGQASKNAVLAAVIRRYPDIDIHDDDNEADSLVMAAMAADHLGCPFATVPQLHRGALAKVEWPTVIAGAELTA